MASLQAQKRALRKSVSAALQALSGAEVQSQSRKITDNILSAPWFQRSRTVSCYLSMPTGEVDTSPLVSELLRLGKSLFVPKIDASTAGHMDFLKIYGEEDLHSLPGGVWGIKEPTYDWQDQPRLNAQDGACDPLDLILLPGVAFDATMSRLGHGKGYYDRFISSYAAKAVQRGGTRPLLVALALRQQILETGRIPIGEHDWKVDFIVSPDGIMGNPEGSH